MGFFQRSKSTDSESIGCGRDTGTKEGMEHRTSVKIDHRTSENVEQAVRPLSRVDEKDYEMQSHNNLSSDAETIEDLRDTIRNLKRSLAVNAESTSESRLFLTTLEKAHGKLKKEHAHLEEKMREAEELINVLKEEKTAHEEEIESSRNQSKLLNSTGNHHQPVEDCGGISRGNSVGSDENRGQNSENSSRSSGRSIASRRSTSSLRKSLSTRKSTPSSPEEVQHEMMVEIVNSLEWKNRRYSMELKTQRTEYESKSKEHSDRIECLEKELEQHKERCDTMQVQIDSMTGENERLARENEELHEAMEAKEKEMDDCKKDAQIEKEEVERQLQTQKQHSTQQQNEIERLNRELCNVLSRFENDSSDSEAIALLRDQVEDLQAEKNKLLEENKRLLKDKKDTNVLLDKLDDILKQYRSQIQQMQTKEEKLKNREKDLQSSMESLRVEKEEGAAQIEAMSKEIDHLKEELKNRKKSEVDLSRDIATLTKEIVRHQEELEDSMESEEEMTSEIATLTREIELLRDELKHCKELEEDTQTEMSCLADVREKLSSVIEEQYRQLHMHEQVSQGHLERIKQLEASNEELQQQIKDAKHVNEALSSSVRTSDEETRRLKRSVADGNNKCEESESERLVLKTLLSAIELERDEQLRRHESELNQIRERNRALSEENREIASQIKRLTNEKEHEVQKYEELLESSKRQQSEVERLKQDLSTAVSQIAGLRREGRRHSTQSQISLKERNDLLADRNQQLETKLKVLTAEKEEMQALLEALGEGLRYYQEQEHSTQRRQAGPEQETQQPPAQSSTERDSEQQSQYRNAENESLQRRVNDLQRQLQEQLLMAAQKEEAHAKLEEDFKKRLMDRLERQFNETKIAMEQRLREELAEEYEKNLEKLNEERDALSKSQESMNFDSSSSQSSTLQEQNDQLLRCQLEKVKEDHERWRSEQDRFKQKVLDSQSQLEQARQGYLRLSVKERERSLSLQRQVENLKLQLREMEQLGHRVVGERSQFQKIDLDYNDFNKPCRQLERHRQSFLKRNSESAAKEGTCQFEKNQMDFNKTCRREKSSLLKRLNSESAARGLPKLTSTKIQPFSN